MPLFERLRDIVEFRAEDGGSAERDFIQSILDQARVESASSPNNLRLIASGAKSFAREVRAASSPGPANPSSIALASAAGSSIATSVPNRPPSRISRGPEGQSVETTGKPKPSASTRTVGRPSWRELITNKSAVL